MTEDSKIGLIYRKIPAVMNDIEAISKNRLNTIQNFKFRGVDDIYNALHSILAKHGIFTVPTIMNRQYKEKTTSKGSLMTERILTIRYRFYAEDGSYVDAEVDGESMDTGDKTTNKCMSVAHKYALLQVFCIPTEDEKDPDFSTPEVKSVSWKIGKEEQEKIIDLASRGGMTLKDVSDYIQSEFKKKSVEMTENEYLKLISLLAKKRNEKTGQPQELEPWEKSLYQEKEKV